jgi:anaerobic ribonucleoside-triphosphate reductase
MASADLRQNPNTYHQGPKDAPYYSTVMVPASISMSIAKRAGIEEQLLPLMTGGTVHRIYMGENEPDYRGVKKIALRIADGSRIPYFDFTATFSKCPVCYTTRAGFVQTCDCGSPMRVYSRITGYYRDMMAANPGKVAEFMDRKYVSVGESLNAQPIHA